MKRFEVGGELPTLDFAMDIIKAKEGDLERRMGGFLTTNRVDREGQSIVGAIVEGNLNTKPYEEYGLWNDNHSQVTVGHPYLLRFEKGRGYYTEGKLLPNIHDGGLAVERANYYWGLAKALREGKGERTLGLSVEGKIDSISPCRSKIYKATIIKAAVCEIPMNPDCQLQILEKSFADLCSCNECRIIKSLTTDSAENLIREDLEGADERKAYNAVVRAISEIIGVEEKKSLQILDEAKHHKGRGEADPLTEEIGKFVKKIFSLI